MLLKEYNFETKYKANNFNFVDASFRHSNYRKKTLNDICLSTFQRKLQNIVMINIDMSNENQTKTKKKLKNELLNENSLSLKNATSQTIRREKTKKITKMKIHTSIFSKNF